MINPADGWCGDDGRALVGQSGLVFKEDLARDTSGHQRDAYQRSEGLYAMKPNYAAHNLKKKTGKQHITGYARATQIMVGISEVSTMVVGACCHS
ncbi:hypothetical protein [Bradyrhizobium sp. JYMT SZCCT0428]|uniref:hypothetical protein n=1 Tax=Bradyrhizobium sp. JYMT SZCCT0428 TaxID=2807673 RepID=UPI001BADC5F9|nr:hypothetical protein [Bradyrhizobium sp. JYMT SZCCT0428]MBR1155383.1 hypothetical protein [Bradyrhizobium sp. JYMT SZCCT0428]